MKILYVNGANAEKFDSENKKHPVFAKYFSPTCPACIAMEDVWDNTCREVDEKYDTDMIMAQIDPDGVSELEKMDTTYSDVAYVPSLVLLENGKKKLEYEGPREKDKLIDFLVKQRLIKLKSNMRGGAKKTRNKKTRNKKTRNKKTHKKKTHKRMHVGSGQFMSKPNFNEDSNKDSKEEFSFVENKDWLEPFLSKLLEQSLNDPTKIVTNEEAIDFAIKNVNSIFRPKGLVTKEFVQYKKDWEDCPKKGLSCLSSECRKSPRFGNRCVPSVRKFDPKYSDETYKYNITLAEQSYNYLKNSDKINTILRTPSSDYTRFSLNGPTKLDKEFINRLRNVLALDKNATQERNYFKAILDAYVNKNISLNSNTIDSTTTGKDIENEVHNEIDDEINIMDVPLDKLHLYTKGGRKTNAKKTRDRKFRKFRKFRKSRKSRNT